MARGWKNAAFEPDGLGKAQTNKDTALPTMEKLVEAVRKAPAEKTLDQKNGAAVHFQRETVTSQAPVSETLVKQGGRPIPLYVIDQVGRRLGVALRRGADQVRIQLRPPHLGSVQLDMAMKDNILKVIMVAEHHSVKELLMSHVYELKQALVEHGVELQRVDVEIDYHFDQSTSNAQRDPNKAQSWRHSLDAASGQSENETDSAEEVTPVSVRSDSLLDMFA
jgi:flagellar hook-length control protein FliK